MEDRRTHYFPASDDYVVTAYLPGGNYVAYRVDTDDGCRVRGIGFSRLEAIADLVEQLKQYEEENQ